MLATVVLSAQETLSNLAERLHYSYSRIVYPVAMGDMPIQLEKMAIYNEDGNITGYYSINSLAQALGGSTLVPVPFGKKGLFSSVRWSFDKANNNADEKSTKSLMLSYGLVDMTATMEAKDINVSALLGNEFGLFDIYEFGQIPKGGR